MPWTKQFCAKLLLETESIFKRMIKLQAMAFVVVGACAALAATQLCTEDAFCFDGQFCDTASKLASCRPCLSCKALKREDPPLNKNCVRSIRECGPCLKDLVDSRADDLICVPREEEPDGSMPWVIAGVVVLIVVLLVVTVAVYVLKNPNILVRLRTDMSTTLPTHQVPTAPMELKPPPPYSPQAHHEDDTRPDEPHRREDSKVPLIETYQPPFPMQESQGHGRAGVYTPPVYVRNVPNWPPAQEGHNDVNGNYSPAEGNDDTTQGSIWFPGDGAVVQGPGVHASGGQTQDGASAGGLSAALAAARNTDLILQPSAGAHRSQTVQLNLNNEEEFNSDDEAHAYYNAAGGEGPGGGVGGSYNIVNLNQTITIFKQ